MTAEEFVAVRKRLNMSGEDVAAEFNLTPAIVNAWERGSLRGPRNVAQQLQWRDAIEEQRKVLSASGLPECADAVELERATVGKEADALIASWDAFATHAAACPRCQARDEYLKQYGPAVPELPMPRLFRLFAWVTASAERLPRPLQLAAGPATHGRRMGLWIAACFSALAIAIAAMASISTVVRGGRVEWWIQIVKPILVVVPAYFIGFFLAGAVYDVLRPIGHRFIGYVLRWGIGGGVVYGTIALLMPLIDKEPMSWSNTLGFAGLLGGVWAVIGAVLWFRDRAKGKLPQRVT